MLTAHAQVLVLKELATNAPTLFYMHVPGFLKAIWAGIGDPKQMIREAAIENLRACLLIISERDSSVRTKWYLEVWHLFPSSPPENKRYRPRV